MPRRRLAELAATILRGERQSGNLSIVYTNGRRMRSLNRRFRGIDRGTDVLSFPIDEDGDDDLFGTRMIGEVYVNVALARRRGRQDRCGLFSHLALLTSHGILHLLGYDHHNPTDARAMGDRERRYLSGLGLIDLVAGTAGGGVGAWRRR